MMPLHLVPKTPPTPAEKIRRKVRQTREDGVLQCNRCGCRGSVTVVEGAWIEKGRVVGGTVTARHACANCFKRGVIVSLLPELTAVRPR